jgi:hypothetical protein
VDVQTRMRLMRSFGRTAHWEQSFRDAGARTGNQFEW